MGILLCVLLLPGCGQKTEADNSLERVKKAGEISFSMSGGYPPFNYYNDKNELVGLILMYAKR
jgi:polar amino acid transport system substrate-binding protein